MDEFQLITQAPLYWALYKGTEARDDQRLSIEGVGGSLSSA